MNDDDVIARLKRIEALLLLLIGDDGESEETVTTLDGETQGKARDPLELL